jgi:hypothetical protein
MKKTTKKSVIVLIGILTVSLVAGNVLFAGGVSESASGFVGADDVTFLSSNSASGSSARENQVSSSSSDLISAEDIAFAATPFNSTLVASGSSGSGSAGGLVNAADVNFARSGSVDSDTANLVCVVNGVQATGKVCVN